MPLPRSIWYVAGAEQAQQVDAAKAYNTKPPFQLPPFPLQLPRLVAAAAHPDPPAAPLSV